MTADPTDPSALTDDVLQAVRELLENATEGVSSEEIAGRLDRDRLSVEQALKQLAEHDRLTASFYVDKPALVSEVGDIDAADDIPPQRGSDAPEQPGEVVAPQLGGVVSTKRPQDYDEFEPTATRPQGDEAP